MSLVNMALAVTSTESNAINCNSNGGTDGPNLTSVYCGVPATAANPVQFWVMCANNAQIHDGWVTIPVGESRIFSARAGGQGQINRVRSRSVGANSTCDVYPTQL